MLYSTLHRMDAVKALQMNLYDFIIEQNKLTARFADFWHQSCKKDIENFPMTLEPGEWDEQLRVFAQTEKLS